MRASPPPVQVTLGLGAVHRFWPVLLVVPAAPFAAAWLVWHGWCATGPAALGAGLLMAFTAALAASPTRRHRAETWSWDGLAWHDTTQQADEQQPGELVLVLDLGAALLLRTRSPARPHWRWWWLTRRELPTRWHGLRLVLVHGSRAPRPSRTAS